MRANLVVVAPPRLDADLRFGARTKPFEAQTLVAKLAVEAFCDAILPRLAGLDQRRADPLRDDPRQQSLGYAIDLKCSKRGTVPVATAVGVLVVASESSWSADGNAGLAWTAA
jgi:hypothetical protein